MKFGFFRKKQTVKKMIPIRKEVVEAQKSNAATNDFSKMMGLGFINEEVKMFHQ